MTARLEFIKDRYFTDFGGNFIGGLTAAVVALPIALAFGVSSGLGATAGLYGAIATGIFAALFGGTRGQVSGPTGPMTVVVSAMFAASPHHPELVFASVILGGILQIVMGKIKAGQVIEYIPYPVVSGFMTGIGAIIICLQLQPFIGVQGYGGVLKAIQSFPGQIASFNPDAVLIGAVTLAIIYILPRITDKLPATLIALVAATAMAQLLHMDIPRIGAIPEGIPIPKIPVFHFTDLHLLLTNAVSLSILGALDSLLTSVVVDKTTKTRHNSDQELIGQGIGNVVSGFIQGLPGAGATMRSIVCIKSGGTTYLSGVIHGLILLAVLLGLGDVAAIIPKACLAGILISVGIGIMDYRGLSSIGKAPKSDVIVMLVVLFLTVFVDLIIAVLVGVTLACTLFAKKIADAQLSEVGTIESLEHLHEVSTHLPRETWKTIFTYTFNGPIFFGEVKNFTNAVSRLTQAKYIILRFYNVPMIDQTGAYALEDAVTQWEARGIHVLFVGLQEQIRKELTDIGVIHKIEMENCFDNIEHAIEAIDALITEETAEQFSSEKSEL